MTVRKTKNSLQPLQQPLFATPREVLSQIRNYLAGQSIGITRDEAILEEVVKCAFCRVYLERTGEALELPGLDVDGVASKYKNIFQRIKDNFPKLFPAEDDFQLENPHIAYVDQALSTITLSNLTHDLIGDIYETFIGSGYRGQEGQFFTPKVAVRTLIEITDPQPEDVIVDPACGSGSFLLEAARAISSKGNIPSSSIHGVDKDKYLVRLAHLHMALQFDTIFPINCADSLAWQNNGFDSSSTKSLAGQYTLILTNPPFGAKIIALTGEGRSKFKLAHKWRYSKKTDQYEMTSELASNPSPQILFVERCISLLAPGGRMGMVIPESVLSNPNHRHVVQYILRETKPIAVIGMPESLFKTSGRGGTHTKVCLLVVEKSTPNPDDNIFMAEAKWCGHDSRAREISKDDMPEIIGNFKRFKSGEGFNYGRLGFSVPYSSVRNNILAPRFYDPEATQLTSQLEETHDFYMVSELVKAKYLSISTGDEVGKMAYGTGEIPFVRTSDISNWEIKVDPKHLLNRDIYSRYAHRQDVREGDILMVRDGTYLIGTCAIISRYDTEIVYQSHLYKIRIHEGAPFDAYLLLAILSSPPVIAQIKSMSFTQDIIDTLGDRIHEIILPVPKSLDSRTAISNMVRQAIESRVVARELTRKARLAVINEIF